MTIAEQALHVTNFQERAQSLIEGLSDMQVRTKCCKRVGAVGREGCGRV